MARDSLMKNTGLVLTSLVLLAAFAVPVQGQSLADAARREAERRARLKEPAKVFTNADVDALPARATGPATPAKIETLLALEGSEPSKTGAAPQADAAAAAAAAVGPANLTVREK